MMNKPPIIKVPIKQPGFHGMEQGSETLKHCSHVSWQEWQEKVSDYFTLCFLFWGAKIL